MELLARKLISLLPKNPFKTFWGHLSAVKASRQLNRTINHNWLWKLCSLWRMQVFRLHVLMITYFFNYNTRISMVLASNTMDTFRHKSQSSYDGKTLFFRHYRGWKPLLPTVRESCQTPPLEWTLQAVGEDILLFWRVGQVVHSRPHREISSCAKTHRGQLDRKIGFRDFSTSQPAPSQQDHASWYLRN